MPTAPKVIGYRFEKVTYIAEKPAPPFRRQKFTRSTAWKNAPLNRRHFRKVLIVEATLTQAYPRSSLIRNFSVRILVAWRCHITLQDFSTRYLHVGTKESDFSSRRQLPLP
jgi:hypothetical protein